MNESDYLSWVERQVGIEARAIFLCRCKLCAYFQVVGEKMLRYIDKRGLPDGYIKLEYGALAGVAQEIELWPANQRVTSSIPSQGTCLGCGPGSPVGGTREAITHGCFSPSLSLSFLLSLKLNK